jgi:NAD(P)-dependent dehydrogenase (short-subunit alcohol dehydrogenase family)
MGALDGKVAVITGGNSGIGLATAKRFVKEWAYVFITARRQAELDAAVSLIGKNVTAIQGDVSNLNDLDRLYEVVRKVKGHVDIVFAHAGVVDPVSLSESTPAAFDRHFNLNARGVYFTVQKALPLLADKASIILSGSAAWQMGIPGYGAYSATKAALVSFVRSWTAELASRGIRASVISPGPTETPMIHVGSKGSPEGTGEYYMCPH